MSLAAPILALLMTGCYH